MSVTSEPRTWMFQYYEACRAADVLELVSGDVLGIVLNSSKRMKRPKLAKAGTGERCIVTRVERGWDGYATKVVVAAMDPPTSRSVKIS